MDGGVIGGPLLAGLFGSTAASGIATTALIGGTALSAYGSVMRGREESRSALAQEQQLRIQEQQYMTAANERDANRRRDLTSKLETISAIRAGRGVGAGSPTAMAIFDDAIDTGERDISIEKTNLLSRADASRRSADIEGSRASTSLLSGYLGGAGEILKGGYQLSTPYRGYLGKGA